MDVKQTVIYATREATPEFQRRLLEVERATKAIAKAAAEIKTWGETLCLDVSALLNGATIETRPPVATDVFIPKDEKF